MNRQNTEDFLDSENTPYGTIMIDTCQHTVVQNHTMCKTKNELKCKMWTWVIIPIKAGSGVVTNVPSSGGCW